MSAVLESKLHKALELRTDAPAMLDALESMSSFWGTNTLEARRGLRQQLEHQNVLLAEEFIAAFAPLQERVAKVERVVGSLETSCSSVAVRLHEAESAMAAFTDRAADLTSRKAELEGQADDIATSPPSPPSPSYQPCVPRLFCVSVNPCSAVLRNHRMATRGLGCKPRPGVLYARVKLRLDNPRSAALRYHHSRVPFTRRHRCWRKRRAG